MCLTVNDSTKMNLPGKPIPELPKNSTQIKHCHMWVSQSIRLKSDGL